MSLFDWARKKFDLPCAAGNDTDVATIGSVRFIEDSIATRPLAVVASLRAADAPIVWIAGGIDKGATFDELEELVRTKVALFIGIGQAGAAFARALQGWTTTRRIEVADGQASLDMAVSLGFDHLQRCCDGRGTVLLAPLGSSFDRRPVAAVVSASLGGWPAKTACPRLPP